MFAHLFQKCIDAGEIPKGMVTCKQMLRVRKGDRSLACNYRPISFNCVPCKLLEHIFCSNIMTHLDEHKRLSDRRHAFQKKPSCKTQLVTVINGWAKCWIRAGRLTLSFWTSRKLSTPPLMNYSDVNYKAMVFVGIL